MNVFAGKLVKDMPTSAVNHIMFRLVDLLLWPNVTIFYTGDNIEESNLRIKMCQEYFFFIFDKIKDTKLGNSRVILRTRNTGGDYHNYTMFLQLKKPTTE